MHLDPPSERHCGFHRNWTIGCNRSVSFSHPDFGVCIEPFVDPLWKLMRQAAPFAVLSHICEDRRGNRPHPRIVKMLGKDVAQWVTDKPAELPQDSTHPLIMGQSPFYAIAFAVMLGFETIGVIGVDLTEDRYPDPTPASKGYARLGKVAKHLGSRVINLNPDSRMTGLEFGEWKEIRPK
jgi:hypothetical protein